MQPTGGAAHDDILDSSNSLRQTESRGRRESDLRKPSKSRRTSGANVEELRRRVYEFTDLSDYKLSDRVIIRAADIFFYLLIKIVCMTLRWQVRGMGHAESIYASGRRAIFTSWHACIFTASWYWRNRGIVVMSSQSRDAEYTGRFIKRLGYGTARGSATRGGGRALAEMADCLRHGMDAGFMIDGPRGPAYVAKPGAITLARHTGQAILPFHVAVRRYIELPSWDRLKIPLPFTRALVLIGEPIYVSPGASAKEVASKQEQLQSSLDGLRREAEAAVNHS
jgi:lysophospholipid acyltransferase (LPLAT)-like uncharacterized protein